MQHFFKIKEEKEICILKDNDRTINNREEKVELFARTQLQANTFPNDNKIREAHVTKEVKQKLSEQSNTPIAPALLQELGEII